MKNFLPMLLVVLLSTFGSMLYLNGVISGPMLALISAAVFVGLMMFRPKNAAPQSVTDLEQKICGDYARDAFADDEALHASFQAVLKDIAGGAPKAAMKKIQKLAPQCSNDPQRYAVALATAQCKAKENDYAAAILEYNRALVLNPTSELARTVGAAHQRLGELEKARDSYEFALELDPRNLEALSNLATACVASRKYEEALDYAAQALEINENHASSLATSAICYGLLGDDLLYKRYTDLAVRNGYNGKKIIETVSALKK